MPSMAAVSKRGVTNSRPVRASPPPGHVASPVAKLTAMPTPSAAMTPRKGLTSRASRKTASSGRTRPGETRASSKTATTKRKITPASMAAAIGIGIFSISAPSGRKAAVSIISAAASRKAPMAAAMSSPLLAAMRAAPGVDQAQMIGRRWRQESQRLATPLARARPAIQETVWAGVAPSACAAASTTATEAAKPTKTATRAENRRDMRVLRRRGLLEPEYAVRRKGRPRRAARRRRHRSVTLAG